MKTITLSEEAYQRLASWKSGRKDSFSAVVLRAVPKPGSARSILDALRELPPVSPRKSAALTRALEDGRRAERKDPGRDRNPWTS